MSLTCAFYFCIKIIPAMRPVNVLMQILLFSIVPVISWCKKGASPASGKEPVQILILGLKDNVKSNYYVKDMISEETGIWVDSIDLQFNHIIAHNIENFTDKSTCVFIRPDTERFASICNKISVSGEGENSSSDLSHVSREDLQEVLDQADADYLLVLNQHYLKWQEEPMRTVFHIVSYTLYNKDKERVYSGNQYFTSMKLENADKIKQLSRKSATRIASAVAKVIDR